MPVVSELAAQPSMGSGPDGDRLVIGLVNNMPDAALQTTERQFRELLGAASGKREIVLKLFSFPEITRSPAAQEHVRACYSPIEALWAGRLDGLIVTGAEPRAAKLQDEPYWQSMTRLVRWAEQHTTSTVWSCLAAHAAVYFLDGIARQRLSGKLSGVFTCRKSSEHAVSEGLPAYYTVPQSRYNDLPETALVSNGYQVLSNATQVGADMFVKRRGSSLFLFLQGHPEYDARALYREYRRDSTRFLKGEREDPPSIPEGYVNGETAEALAGLRSRMIEERDPELVAAFAAVESEGKFLKSWEAFAHQLYANWLGILSESEQLSHQAPTLLRPTVSHDSAAFYLGASASVSGAGS